ncbi:MAG: primosomal protein N' (replication factor Y) - superfamily II helicase [Planctomycetes bacterium]|nr:primosomal protein N' (replication factor Y) - superfamily II helicase [Planctomycetota bacterium]MCB9902804.1 primosomal protein N' (replication factor Y) - superfamily II helicase [Planctomycetota bacterium]
MTEERVRTDEEREGPPAAGTRASSEQFPCRECGAGMRWDPERDALACDFCGATREVEVLADEIVERPLEEAGDAARGLGLELRVVQCRNCGARLALEPPVTSDSCAYCGSTKVMVQEANRNAIRPESLVPLDVGKRQVEEQFKKWLRKLWFRPNELKRAKRFDAVGIYVPFWTFDCLADSQWTAMSGTYYYVPVTQPVMVNGKLQMQTTMQQRVRWKPARGERSDVYDDLHVHASKGRCAELVRELGPFDTSGLVPYRPEYLAGWRAEEYQIDLADGWEAGRREIHEDQRRRCGADVPGDTQRDLRVRTELSDVRWKHVLLPIWSLSYRFRGATYAVLIHGQTGRVVGKAPYSFVKIVAAILAVCVVLALYLALG